MRMLLSFVRNDRSNPAWTTTYIHFGQARRWDYPHLAPDAPIALNVGTTTPISPGGQCGIPPLTSAIALRVRLAVGWDTFISGHVFYRQRRTHMHALELTAVFVTRSPASRVQGACSCMPSTQVFEILVLYAVTDSEASRRCCDREKTLFEIYGSFARRPRPRTEQSHRSHAITLESNLKSPICCARPLRAFVYGTVSGCCANTRCTLSLTPEFSALHMRGAIDINRNSPRAPSNADLPRHRLRRFRLRRPGRRWRLPSGTEAGTGYSLCLRTASPY
ncbi:hypothetical protein C8T65DRAFT_120743 [Cerioporus squamosus]|nr:hypothetical protein C8T65DRAFT_120743 [Cerioporus squamosus]